MLCPTHTCHHAPTYHRGLVNGGCFLQRTHVIMHPLYHTAMRTYHHAAIYHRGPPSGIALSNAHLSSCTHIPPGPWERWAFSPKRTCHHAPLIPQGNAHMPRCSHIPPGPSERQCSAQRTPAILHPYTTGAFERCSVQYTHGIIYPYTTGACERFFVQGTHAIMHPYTTGQCPHAIMQPVLSFRMHPRRKFKVQSSRFKV